jgi:predicted nucleic acid-binding protein
MKTVLVDANVLVSFLTDRNPEQRERAFALLLAAREREHSLVLLTISISETIYVLRNLYKVDPQEIADSMRQLLGLPGVASGGDVSWSLVFTLWPEVISNLGDAMIAAAASEGGYDAVATFDRDLRRKLAQQGAASYWAE